MCYDVDVPRTTLHLKDDAMRAAKDYAVRHGISLGEAVSELVQQAADRPLITDIKDGFPVVRLSGTSEKVTSDFVKRLLDEWP